MTPEEQAALAETEDRAEAITDGIQATAGLGLEAIKLKIAHQERLIVLNAGTLALTFSAATAYHSQHVQAASANVSLLHAWQMMLSSIFLSIIANWMNMLSASHFSLAHANYQLKTRFGRWERAMDRVQKGLSIEAREEVNISTAKFERSEGYGNKLAKWAGFVGLFSQIGTCWGLVCLYNFAKAVITS